MKRKQIGVVASGARTTDHIAGRPMVTGNQSAAVLQLQRSAGNTVATLWIQRTPRPDGTIVDRAELERSRPVGAAVDAETRLSVMEALLATPRTRTILDAISALRGDLSFAIVWSSQGNYHRNGMIFLDRRGNETAWLAGTAHEITHLHAHLAGTSANVRTMGRDEYVNTQMAEEIGAHAAAYVAQLQMGRATSPSAGYGEFRAQLVRDHADLLRSRNWTAIEALARPFVEAKYRTEWVGSATRRNYWEKWRAVWDAAHPTP